MSSARRGVVVDTMVTSWLFDERPNPRAEQYRGLIDGRPIVLAFQTVMELRYGALHAGWGELRRLLGRGPDAQPMPGLADWHLPNERVLRFSTLNSPVGHGGAAGSRPRRSAAAPRAT